MIDKQYNNIVLAGHSPGGGGIVPLYALKHPQDLKGIILTGNGARLRVHPHCPADNVPGARATVIPGGTHMVFAEKPDEANRIIDDFLKSI